MSNTCTSINLPGVSDAGWNILGRVAAKQAIKELRAKASRDLATALAITRARDEDFRIAIVSGPVGQHEIEVLQEGK